MRSTLTRAVRRRATPTSYCTSSNHSRLAALPEALPPVSSLSFAANPDSCRESSRAIPAATHSKLQVDRLTWWLIHALRRLVPLCRDLSVFSYLWNDRNLLSFPTRRSSD